MTQTKIKFCGLSRRCDIETANDLRPDYVGFVFAKSSRRYVSPKQAGELKKMLKPITNTMLTNALKELEGDGLVHREQYNEIPPRVEYSLTEKGTDLLPIFYAISQWGMKYIP